MRTPPISTGNVHAEGRADRIARRSMRIDTERAASGYDAATRHHAAPRCTSTGADDRCDGRGMRADLKQRSLHAGVQGARCPGALIRLACAGVRLARCADCAACDACVGCAESTLGARPAETGAAPTQPVRDALPCTRRRCATAPRTSRPTAISWCCTTSTSSTRRAAPRTYQGRPCRRHRRSILATAAGC